MQMAVNAADEQRVTLPFRKAMRMSLQNIRARFLRSLITTGGVVLAVAFLMFVLTTLGLQDALRGADEQELVRLSGQLSDSIVAALANEGEGATESTWLMGLSILVGVIGISNAMLMAVTERYREIATLKCLGALDRFVVHIFLIESMLQGAVGAFCGVFVGFAVGLAVTVAKFGSVVFWFFPFHDLALGGLMAFVVGVIIAVLGSVYPAYAAARMSPVEAMRLDQL